MSGAKCPASISSRAWPPAGLVHSVYLTTLVALWPHLLQVACTVALMYKWAKQHASTDGNQLYPANENGTSYTSILPIFIQQLWVTLYRVYSWESCLKG